MLFSKRLTPAPPLALCLEATIQGRSPSFQAELIPVRSPLLRESYLVPFPPLTYMLKFSGFADLTSCCAGVGSPKDAKTKIATRKQHNKHKSTQDANSQVAVARAISHLNAPQDQEIETPKPYGTQRHKPVLRRTSLHEDSTSTEAGILPGISRECNARSSIHWFTEFCNSQ